MANQTIQLKFTKEIEATAEHVYFAFTTGMGLREWFAKVAEANLEKANYFYLYWQNGEQASGQFSDLEENRSLRMRWQGLNDPGASTVKVKIKPKDDSTSVTVIHELPSGEGEWAATRESLTTRWMEGLENLKDVLETGLDQRLYKRPMLGIFLGDFITKEAAARKGLPFEYGHKITGVIAKMGADNAGLRKEDIIVHIDGIKIKDYEALDQVIRAHQSGDTVALDYLRDGEVQTVQFQLSGRPVPEIPPHGQALSEAMSSFYKSANAQLRELIEDVTDEQAEFRPAPAEWNTKDVFAHLIASERDTYNWATALALNEYRMPYTSNATMRLKSIRSNLPDLPALFNGLQAAQNEGVTLLSELPPEFSERKSTFVPLAAELVEGIPHHYKDHIAQMNDNLSAARALN